MATTQKRSDLSCWILLFTLDLRGCSSTFSHCVYNKPRFWATLFSRLFFIGCLHTIRDCSCAHRLKCNRWMATGKKIAVRCVAQEGYCAFCTDDELAKSSRLIRTTIELQNIKWVRTCESEWHCQAYQVISLFSFYYRFLGCYLAMGLGNRTNECWMRHGHWCQHNFAQSYN